MNTGLDTCPGDPYELALGDSLTLSGTTAGATDDYKSFCGDMTAEVDGADIVYQFTLAEDGIFRIEVTAAGGSDFDPALVVRSDQACDDESTDTCFDYQHSAVEAAFGPYTAGVYYVIIDGASASSGDFVLEVSLDAAACGDGVLSRGEECDVVPISPNDGCSDPGAPDGGCKFEPPTPAKDVCPGESFMLTTAGLKLAATDGHSNIGYTDDYLGSCTPGMGGKDRVYAIVPQVSGMMTAAAGFMADGVSPACETDPNSSLCFDIVLYARSTCDVATSELDCSDIDGITPEIITMPVTANVPVYVFVDGFDAAFYSAGTYNLDLSLTP